jgi:hypothetical protein
MFLGVPQGSLRASKHAPPAPKVGFSALNVPLKKKGIVFVECPSALGDGKEAGLRALFCEAGLMAKPLHDGGHELVKPGVFEVYVFDVHVVNEPNPVLEHP